MARVHQVSQDELTLAIFNVVQEIKQYQRGQKGFDGVIVIAKGGMAVAPYILHQLDLKVPVSCIHIESYTAGKTRIGITAHTQPDKMRILPGHKHLIIDDLVDSGETAAFLWRQYPLSLVAAPWGKPLGIGHLNKLRIPNVIGNRVEQDVWLEFPWEVKINAATRKHG